MAENATTELSFEDKVTALTDELHRLYEVEGKAFLIMADVGRVFIFSLYGSDYDLATLVGNACIANEKIRPVIEMGLSGKLID